MNNNIENPEEYALFLELRKKYEPLFQKLAAEERKKHVIDLDTYLTQRSKEGKGTYLTNSDGSFSFRVYGSIKDKINDIYENPFTERTKEEWDWLIIAIEEDFGIKYEF